jgi:hypothetical protein
VSDSPAASGPNANPAKMSPIRSVTQDVLRPVMNEVIEFKMNPLIWGQYLLWHLRNKKTQGFTLSLSDLTYLSPTFTG